MRTLGALPVFVILLSTASPGLSVTSCNPEGYPTSLSWKHGAPVVYVSRPEDKHLSGFRPQNTPLVWRSAMRRIEVHPVEMELHFRDERPGTPISILSFRFRSTAGDVYRPRLTLPPKDYHEAPIRIIESGNWFQHVAIYGLELAREDDPQDTIPLNGHLEWKAWPNRGSVEFVPGGGEPPLWKSIEAIRTETSNIAEVTLARTEVPNESLKIEYNLGDEGKIAWSDTHSAADAALSLNAESGTVVFNRSTRAWEMTLPGQDWPKIPGQAYPESALDRITRFPFTVRNTSDKYATVRLRFVHPSHPITGFAPMLLDENGQQTGLPIQVSKNWHTRKGYPDLPYQGSWIHTSSILRLPPNTTQSLEYAIVHAQWKGVPIASGHQLSLVGWGSNGFWHQMAVGSWGETICFQPGRVLRRSMLTDIRPLFQPGMGSGSPYSWTSNIGGGDVGLIHDAEGRYIPWKDERVEYRAIGPIWSEVTVRETLANDAASLSTTIMLPRTDDMVRVYFALEFEVHADLPYSRFALFQFGTDYYASARTLAVHWSEGTSTPEDGQDAIPWTSDNPWVWLESSTEAPNERTGFGQRGLILRKFSGTVGGEAVGLPWLAMYPLADTAPNLSAELTIKPQRRNFRAGDQISALVEMVILPGSLDAYIGPNDAFAASLLDASGFSHVISTEAHANQTTLQVKNGRTVHETLPVITADEARQEFSVAGGRGLINVKITGLESPGENPIIELIDRKPAPLGKTNPEEAEPQWTWTRETQLWDLFLSLRATDSVPPEARRFQFTN